MRFKDYGFGMFGWENGDIAIAGGIRDHGYHPAGQMRCRFAAYDLAKARREGKQAEEVASLVLLVNLGDGEDVKPSIDKFINIQVAKPLRKTGLGKRIVAAALEAAAADMEICDIKKNAKGFWVKSGATEFETRGSKGLIYAVMRKRPEAVSSLDDLVPADGQAFTA